MLSSKTPALLVRVEGPRVWEAPPSAAATLERSGGSLQALSWRPL